MLILVNLDRKTKTMKSNNDTKSITDDFLVKEAIREGSERFQRQKSELETVTYRLTENELQDMKKVNQALRLNSEDVPRRAIHYLSFVNHQMQHHLNPDQQASTTESHERDSKDWENWKTRKKEEYLRELKELGEIPQDDPIKQKRYYKKLDLDGEILDKLNQLNMGDEIGESIYLGVALLYHQLVERATQLPAGHT